MWIYIHADVIGIEETCAQYESHLGHSILTTRLIVPR